MSVAPDSVGNLPHHRRPPEWGSGSTGPKGDRVYFILNPSIEAIGLLVRLDQEHHGIVEPARAMLVPEYESRLASTRDDWVTAWPT
jgi:hypothetical protein